jgi:hypothetical protein
MKNKKIILEQSNPQTIDLTKAVKLNCFDAYKVWFDIDPGNQPKKTKSGKSVVSGKNKKGEVVFFFDNGIVKNVVTNVQKHWKCDSVNSMNQSQTTNSDLLKTFGLTANDTAKAKQITGILQALVDKGAVSDIFMKWNDLLTNVFRDSTLLKLNPDNNEVPMDKEDLQLKYGTDMKDTLQRKYGWNNISLYLPTGSVSQATNVEINLDQPTCNQILSTYVQSAFQYQYQNITPRLDRLKMQSNINTCYGGGMFNNFTGFPQNVVVTNSDGTTSTKPFLSIPENKNPFGFFRKSLNFNFIRKLLNGETDYITNRNPYVFSIGGIQKESKEKALKSLISENLITLSNEKKKNNISESNIIKTRGNILIENRLINTKEQQEKFFNEILSESIYLNLQGFDKQIIKEEFWDSLKGLFGEDGSKAIFARFKEYMGKYLVGKLTSINPNGWMGKNIKKSINKIHIEDLDKITDCEFISRKVSTSITNSIITKVSKGQEIEGGNISSIVKSGLDKSIDRTELTKNIHEGISKLICPVLGDVSKKLKQKGEEMKLKAVRP